VGFLFDRPTAADYSAAVNWNLNLLLTNTLLLLRSAAVGF